MKESDFFKLCQEELNLKNTKEARERVNLFWNTIIEVVDSGNKAVFKDWGNFYLHEVKSRKVIIPTVEGEIHTKPKKVMKFYCGKALRARVNNDE